MKLAIRAVFSLACVGALASVPAFASTILYDNSTATSGTLQGWTMGTGSGGNSVSDSFTVSSSAIATGANFWIVLQPGDSLQSVEWSIGLTPFGGTPAVAVTSSSGQVGTEYGSYPVYDESISLPDVALLSGTTYWFTLQDGLSALDPVSFVEWDQSNGPSTAFQNEPGYGVPSIPSETFQITGSSVAPTPEPSSILLLASGLTGLASMLRRKIKV
jgi:PEP-CTERM motif